MEELARRRYCGRIPKMKVKDEEEEIGNRKKEIVQMNGRVSGYTHT